MRALERLGIGAKLTLAFGALASVTVLVVVFGFFAGGSVTRDIGLAEAARAPASLTSARAQASLLRMQLHVRGYLVLGDPLDIEQYRVHKEAFEADLAALRSLAKTWPEQEALVVSQLTRDYEQWVRLPQKLFELHDNPLKNRPALRLARLEVQPRRVEVLGHIDSMIGIQERRDLATPNRALMARLVAFQTSFDAMATNLMAYAASGELNFKLAYGPQLATNAALWRALAERRDSLDRSQREHFDVIVRQRAEIGELALRIVNVLSGDRAYEDLYLYRTQADPQTQELLRLLQVLTTNQQSALQAALARARDSVRSARVPAILGGVLAVLLAVALAFLLQRHIVAALRARQDMIDLAQKAARAVAFEWRIGPGGYDTAYEQWKTGVHPEDWPAVQEALERAHRSGEVAVDYRTVQRQGAVRSLQAKGRMLFDAEGKPARMVGFMLDVTEQRQAEEELKRMERQLRHGQRLEAMGTLAGGIAHDFNNILGAILGYGEMALRDAPRGTRLRRDLDSIVSAGERGRALVDRILAFSRSGLGDQVAVHVERVVREALDHLSAKLPAGIMIEARLSARRAAMQGDPTQVHQVLMNLATNAIQAMPDGGRLCVALRTERIEERRVATIGTVGPGELIVLEVADTGSGIAPDMVDRIFDPFFTTKDVGVGTGLGLSLVHGIVTQVGGAIDVSSTPGKGSVFTVYLPHAGEAPEEADADKSALQRGNRQRVLVVDDEEALMRLTTETLQELGYEPLGFTSSSAALETFRASPQGFDVLVTDERMPGMPGSRLIREVRDIRRDIPIVLMSGFVGGTVLTSAREAGADEVLKKPLSARDLASSLARVLQAQDARVG